MESNDTSSQDPQRHSDDAQGREPDRRQSEAASGNEQLDRDTSYSPASGIETEERQEAPARSAAIRDAGIDPDDVKVLPGTGGPDDTGDIDVDPSEINPTGR